MKITQKDLVINTMKNLSADILGENGISTQSLSEIVGISRANLSRILNELVKEGVLNKNTGRPVLYKINNTEQAEFKKFSNLIGYNGSLKNSIQLAKAAVMYPQHRLMTILYGDVGVGKKKFIQGMINFAIMNKKIEEDYILKKIDFKDFSEKDHEIDIEDLGLKGLIDVLILSNLNQVTVKSQEKIILDIERNYPQAIRLVVLDEQSYYFVQESIGTSIPIHIEMKSYSEKPYPEKLEFIEYLFSLESIGMKKDIHVNAEIIYSLLLSNPKENIKELAIDIKNACAKAYVRNMHSKSQFLTLVHDDFPIHIRKSIVNYKKYRIELHALLAKSAKLVFSQNEITKSMVDKMDVSLIHEEADAQIKSLKERGMSEEDIEDYVSADLSDSYQKYRLSLIDNSKDIETLSKIVSRKLINIVVDFIKSLSNKTQKYYDERLVYSLSLHIHNQIIENKKEVKTNRWTSILEKQLIDLIDNMDFEYEQVKKLAHKLEEEFSVLIDIKDIVDILYLIDDSNDVEAYNKQPTMIIVMHGKTVASSISETINELTKSKISEGFDLPLELPPMDNYNKLKNRILEADQGAGVVILYDMGSISTMVQMIQNEIDTKLSLIQLPATLQALDIARKCLIAQNIENIEVSNIDHEITDINYQSRSLTKTIKKVILTVCKTGQGGALHMKQYIEDTIVDKNVRVIDLAVANQEEFLNELNMIRQESKVISIVGTFEPVVYPAIPFIGVSNLFEINKNKLETLLRIDHPDVFYEEEFFENIEDNLVVTDIDLVRKFVSSLITNLALYVEKTFTTDQFVGLFIHVAFNIDRLRQGISPVLNKSIKGVDTDSAFFKKVSKELKIIEKNFDIVFSDKEISLLIDYILER